MKISLLKGGRVLDPGSNVDVVCDVRLRDGRIDALGLGLAPERGGEVIDCTGQLVLPGLIDTHAHVYQHVTGRFGLNADMCGVHSGVTTLVDQGGPSCMTLPGFRHFVAQPARSGVYAFLSAYLVGGLEGHYYPELYRPDCVNVDATVRVADANRDLIKGIKAHAEIGGFARWGSDVIRLSAEIGKQTGLPLYIHFGQLWPMPNGGGPPIDPDTILDDVLDLLKPGDILAHPFSRHPGGFVDKNGRLHPLVKEAVARGLKIDVGHGSHFSFAMARKVLDAGILPDTLGADMHGYNTTVPAPAGSPESHPDEEHLFKGSVRFSLASTMTTMMALGMTLEQVVPMVTGNAAAMLGLDGMMGALRPGLAADVTVLADERGRWAMRDNEQTQVIAERMLRPIFCLRGGEYFSSDASILPVARVA